MKKFMFAIMAIAAGLVFGSCASEEEQTEEQPQEDTVVVETPEIDTTIVEEEPVVEEVATPAPKKTAAKKTAAKEETKAAPTAPAAKAGAELKLDNSNAQKPGIVKNPNAQEKTEAKTVEISADKKGVKVGLKK